MTHPKEQDLALYATGDTGFVDKIQLTRHLRACDECLQTVQEYRSLSAELSDLDLDLANWDSLAAEMKANIHVGLEAGACVRKPQTVRPLNFFNTRMAVATASLLTLAAAALLLKQPKFAAPAAATTTVMASQQSVKVDSEGVTITNVILE
jgi:hypothetical protein